MSGKGGRKKDTVLIHEGRDPQSTAGTVNMPVYRASTICFPTVAALEHARDNRLTTRSYGRQGTPTNRALEDAVAALEGGYRSLAVSSGLAAIAGAMLTFVKSGDHVLMVDSTYGPARRFCDGVLKRFGVSTTYYDPLIGAGIAELMRPETRIVYTESPGSLTFEMQDIPAIAEVAHKGGAVVLNDNTWGTPYNFRSFEKGVDVSIHAATKYIVGHSDVMLGMIVTNEANFAKVKDGIAPFGYSASPDDCYLALRGLRTIGVRLKQHQENALIVANWLKTRPEVAQILFPALPDDPGYAIWKRDFTGAASLFSIVLQDDVTKAAVAAMVDHLDLFAMGASWGGFESLILPQHPEASRTAKPWTAKGPMLRLHIGLEDPADLMADLAAGFDRLNAAMG